MRRREGRQAPPSEKGRAALIPAPWASPPASGARASPVWTCRSARHPGRKPSCPSCPSLTPRPCLRPCPGLAGSGWHFSSIQDWPAPEAPPLEESDPVQPGPGWNAAVAPARCAQGDHSEFGPDTSLALRTPPRQPCRCPATADHQETLIHPSKPTSNAATSPGSELATSSARPVRLRPAAAPATWRLQGCCWLARLSLRLGTETSRHLFFISPSPA